MSTETITETMRTPRISFTEAVALLPFGDTITAEHLVDGEGIQTVVYPRNVLLDNLLYAIDSHDAGHEDCGIWRNSPQLQSEGYDFHFRIAPGASAHFVQRYCPAGDTP